MPAVQIMLSPPIVIPSLRAGEITQAQAGFGPPFVFLGTVNHAEHDRLSEDAEQ